MEKESEFWYFLIQGEYIEEQGAYGNFYSYGTHCGDALEKTIQEAINQGLSNPVPIETARLDVLDEFELPEEAIKLAEEVYFKPPFHTFPFADLEEDNYFVCPTGILKGTDNDEEEYELIKEGFTAFDKNENGIYHLELVVSSENHVKTFFNAIDLLPTVDVFWLYIKQHWDGEQTELWAASTLYGKKSVVNFLSQNQNLTIENGYVDCVVHSKVGETNLTLDEHKKIQLHTKDETVFEEFMEGITESGFEQKTELPNIQYDFYHWHYRPANSLTRNNFKAHLEAEGFELIDYWTDKVD
ncbi:hypothetical protein [Rufibacter immobilis]|uniref:hypothetical protein n=1 Tax=Rufibacter immobilis TaxID=1348778 RepID=UPI0035EEA584